ncbi:MAG: glycine-rich domain-containing protein, partial [Burkholderiaceae bacterium]
MAVTTWTAGEVLAAADLNDTFASKPTFTYGTATPTADADGAIWYDENDTPPTPKFWDGSAWQPFSSGVDDAVISSPAATGSYTDSGVTYNYYTFTASGTLTVGTAGRAQVVVIAGGGGGTNGGGGAGGYLEEDLFLSVGSYTVTIGAGGAGRVVNGGQANSGNRTLFYRVAGDGFARNGGGGGSNTQGAVGASAAGSYNAAGNTGNVWEGNDSGSSLASGGGAASGGGGAGAASAVVTGTVGGNGG